MTYITKRFKKFSIHAAASAAVVLSLAACGGGGAGAAAGDTTQLRASSGSSSTATVASGSAGTPSVATAPNAIAAVPYGQDPSAFTLTFSDEFDTLDAGKWNDHAWYETPNATQNYTVEDGALKIWPQTDSTGNFFNRTIDTDGKFTQTYGYFEIEAKLPVGKGTWPAFWLFNHIGNRRPEIDIMEAYAGGAAPWGSVVDGQPHPMMFASTIWQDAGVQAGTQKVAGPDLSGDFHKYALKWEPSRLTFYFDGREVYTANVTMADPMYIMLDLWYGSASGAADGSTPQGKGNAYQVNYVRAWQFK